ncbi:MAG: BON domain-containing protein [Planctomycetota bacterium]
MRRFVIGFAIGLATLSPMWAQANDDQIAQAIIERLETQKSEGKLKGFNIDLQVDQGTVWMKGSVASVEQQRLALDVARRIQGVEKVVNQLKVEGDAKSAASKTPTAAPTTVGPSVAVPAAAAPTAAAPTAAAPAPAAPAPAAATPAGKSDEELLSDVLNRLQAVKKSGQLKGFKLDVHTEGGVVWLTGRVADVAQQQTVIEVVRRVAGVKQVVNELSVAAAEPQVTPTSGIAEGTGVPQMVAAPAAPAMRSAAMMQPAAPQMTAMPAQQMAAMPAQQMAAMPAQQMAAMPNQQMMMANPQAMAAPARMGQPRMAQRPLAFAPSQRGPQMMQVAQMQPVEEGAAPMPMPMHSAGPNVGIAPARYDHPNMPGYAWPSYAAYPNYAAVTYPKQYSPSAWPYIGPFYPYPQVPLGWRKVMLEWDDGWWHLDFKDK